MDVWARPPHTAAWPTIRFKILPYHPPFTKELWTLTARRTTCSCSCGCGCSDRRAPDAAPAIGERIPASALALAVEGRWAEEGLALPAERGVVAERGLAADVAEVAE